MPALLVELVRGRWSISLPDLIAFCQACSVRFKDAFPDAESALVFDGHYWWYETTDYQNYPHEQLSLYKASPYGRSTAEHFDLIHDIYRANHGHYFWDRR